MLLSKVAVFVELYTKRQAIKESADALKRAYDEMERRVEERTSELAATNRSLEAEMAERQRVEIERTQLLEREQRARLEAQAMNRLKDEFLATLSHELRTPLNAILGWTHILEVGSRDNAAVDRATRVIKKNAQAQAQLVADILDVSRIIGGKLDLHLGLVSLRTVIEAALETVQPAADAKGIAVDTVFGDVAPIIGDRDRLQQVMWNLLSNAIKFTPKEGRVRIEVQAQARDIVVTITDSGQGIDPTFLPHVFERFTRPTARSRACTGDSASAWPSFATSSSCTGASMRAARRENLGATFTCGAADAHRGAKRSTPRSVPARAVRRGGSRGAPAARRRPRPGRGRRKWTLSSICALLQGQGATVHAADRPPRVGGVQMRAQDVLVSDIGMPGLDELRLDSPRARSGAA